MPNTEAKWQSEWPTEAGFWWLYGKLYKNDKDAWHFVRIVEPSKSSGFMYITDGQFLYKENGNGGRWTKVQFPALETVART